MKLKISGESTSKELIRNVIRITCVIRLEEELDIILEMEELCVMFVGLMG
jgi:hypothetical protein